MSLYERASRAASAIEGQMDRGNCLRMLRSQVEAMVPIDDLSRLASTNCDLAHNEVRSACRRAFESGSWNQVAEREREHLVEELIDAIFGFGVLEDLINDERITEIMINGPKQVFIERDGTIEPTERAFHSEADLRAFVDRVLGPLGRRVDESSPMVSARLPQGHRMNVVMPPIAIDGPVITIRKFTERVLRLNDLQAKGSIEPELATFLSLAVRLRKSIAVSGGTGSGKTTLLNALSCEIPVHERIITIEDSAELRFFNHPHVVRMEARPRNAEGAGEVSIRDLVINALRMRPDRIVVGECRGAEALDMLQAMSTGHEGSLTTLHANSPMESIARLAMMVRFGVDLPVDVIETNIANAIDLVVQTRRMPDGMRFVSEVVELELDAKRRMCEARQLYKREPGRQGRWLSMPIWIADLESLDTAEAKEMERWKRLSCGAS